MFHKWKPNVYTNTYKSIEQEIPSLAFMDNMTQVVPNKNNLEAILKIADEFYTFTNTAINKDKSKLLTNKKMEQDSIEL